MKLKIHYNSPVVLTFAIVCIVVYALGATIFPGLVDWLFSAPPNLLSANPLHYVRLVTYVFGHADLGHLFGNLIFILLLGPILEEKYGSEMMIWVIAVTAIVSSVLNAVLFSTGAIGASGIVFAFITLASVVNVERNSIPLSFVLVVLVWLGREFLQSFTPDMISQFGHIMGGIIGSVFGFRLARRREYEY